MSVEHAKGFLEKLSTDSALVEKLQAASSDSERQEIAKGLGFEFTKDDLRVVANERKAELSDEDLEAVAGGASATWVGVEIGVFGAAAGGIGAAAAAAA